MARIGVVVLLLACFVGVAAAPGAGAAAPKAAVPKAAAPAPTAPAAPAAKAGAPGAAAATDLAKAVAAMRRVKPEDFSKEQQEAKGKELDAAWKTLIQAGPAGAGRLKQELAKIDAAKEKDDYFKLGAAVVLWQIGNLDEAPAIAAAWSGDVDLALNYNYVFYTAMDAARTQDPRALPMLAAVLRDQKGSVFQAQHAMAVPWPLTHSFLWCAFGPKGLPALEATLANAKDPAVQQSAMLLLARAQYLPALPRIRSLVPQARGDVRGVAVHSLGAFGHPQDYDFLVSGLQLKDPKDVWAHVYALEEYEDLRAVPAVVPLLDSPDRPLRRVTMGCLYHLLTPQGMEALWKHATPAPGASDEAREDAQECRALVDRFLESTNLTWEAYAAKPPAEKEAVCSNLRKQWGEKFVLKADDRRLSHEELLKATEEWMKNGRITGGTYEWVEDRHAMAASTPEDIPLWLNVKAKVCLRISDECLPEMQIIDGLVCRLGRSRYRKGVGICDKVEPAGPAVPAPAARTPAKARPN
jgi:hypothetical protein